MPQHERSSTMDHGRRERHRESRRRHRSPSYDSYASDSESYTSDSSRDPSPRRRLPHKSKTSHSDGETLHDHHSGGRGRGSNRSYYYEDENEDGDQSPTRRSVVEDLLAAVGLIRAKNRDEDDVRQSTFGSRKSRDYKDDRTSRRARSDMAEDDKKKPQRQALQAALTAAAVEAFRTRKEGGLTAQRLMQIAGAAIAAGGLDAIVDRGSNSGSLRHIVESVVAGLAAGNTVGKQVKHSRPGSMKNKVGGGAVGLVTRKLLSRSLSRGPERRKSRRD